MRALLLLVTMAALAAPAFADIWIKGHYDDDGDWVPGYWKTEPNGTTEDNYSSGAHNPHKPPPAPPLKPWTPYRDYGTAPFPQSGGANRGGPKVEIPRMNAPVPSLDKGCKRTSIYDPPCPVGRY